MTLMKLVRPSAGQAIPAMLEQTALGAGFALTLADRLAIERLLCDGATLIAPNPLLLTALLRHKLRISRAAREPAAHDLVVSGRAVTYEIEGEGIRTGTLSTSCMPFPNHVIVASLLGATLIGMRALQTGPLLRSDGSITSVTILDVAASPVEAAA
ncbi:hypothetical protein [Limimaricola sp. AA108-03]|uniref:hypothetical protein n=1 Tax=Limimaricola sp. AA108-03 TaxID=3425945 RepID=UPI003D76CB1C